ncbi:hypothetical protein BP6252_04320 [Coleophoma cylindrospora]|uniref:Bromo domain-containing protein n=1 Tax=Coleophoma cylindrospora TaxID=1849047 RepID=A0A3D8S055_9HELO|nr:hypothetical protein BP6252_04320 [Coleophoma cylindrospora]
MDLGHLLSSKTIKFRVGVGPSEVTLNIHETLLRQQSPTWDAVLGTPGTPSEVSIPSQDPKAFRTMAQWLYAKSLDNINMNYNPTPAPAYRDLGKIAKAGHAHNAVAAASASGAFGRSSAGTARVARTGSSTRESRDADANATADTIPITIQQEKEITKILNKTIKEHQGYDYSRPVGNIWPGYADEWAHKIKNPTDLGTMLTKLKEDAYASFEELKEDINLLYQNAALFSGENSPFAKGAAKVRDVVFSRIGATLPELGLRCPSVGNSPSADFIADPNPSARRDMLQLIYLAESYRIAKLADEALQRFISICQSTGFVINAKTAVTVHENTKKGSKLRLFVARSLADGLLMDQPGTISTEELYQVMEHKELGCELLEALRGKMSRAAPARLNPSR